MVAGAAPQEGLLPREGLQVLGTHLREVLQHQDVDVLVRLPVGRHLVVERVPVLAAPKSTTQTESFFPPYKTLCVTIERAIRSTSFAPSERPPHVHGDDQGLRARRHGSIHKQRPGDGGARIKRVYNGRRRGDAGDKGVC